MHAALAVFVPGCAALCDWQVHRALSGNELSWAYVFEWPFFGAYGTYLWWKLVHDQPAGSPPPEEGTRQDETPGEAEAEVPAPSHREDEELAAYNRYLAALHTSGRPKRW